VNVVCGGPLAEETLPQAAADRGNIAAAFSIDSMSDETTMRRSTISVRRDVLRSWLTISDYTRTKMAEELSVSRGRISQLLNSDQEMSARLIAGLLHLTKLPFERLFVVRPTKTVARRNRVTSKRPADGRDRTSTSEALL
jgi:hypothetical protein